MVRLVAFPERIGRYRVLASLGHGGMGSVYLAHDPSIDRRVAIKVLPMIASADPRAVPELEKRFILEARAAGRLNHPGIVSIYDTDIDREQELAYIAMEWIDGRTLAEILADRGCLTVEMAAEIAAQVAMALDHAHQLSVVHRDIKPSNIIIAKDRRVKVLDFGIAKLGAENHTVVGQVLGTPAFMAPEQLQGLPLDGRSDLFSLGAVLYLSLMGRTPFEGETMVEILQKIMSFDPLPSASADSEIPNDLWHVVARALEKDAAKRFASGRSFAEALRPFRPTGVESDSILEELLVEDAPAVAAAPSLLAPVAAVDGPTAMINRRRSLEGETRNQATERLSLDWRRLKLPFAGPWAPVVAFCVLMSIGLLILAVSQPADRPLPPVELVTPQDQPQAILPAFGDAPEAAEAVENRLQAAQLATVVVSHRNRLKRAWMSVWIDGEQRWSEPISARGNFVGRARGDLVEVELAVPPGRHTIEVRITGARKNVNASKVITGTFDAGVVRRLRAKLSPISGNLELAWKG